MNFDNGFVNNGFITDPSRNCAELDRPYVLVTNHPILNIRVRSVVLKTTPKAHPPTGPAADSRPAPFLSRHRRW